MSALMGCTCPAGSRLLVVVSDASQSILPHSHTDRIKSAGMQGKVSALTASEAKATQLAQNMRRKLGARLRDAEATAAAARKQLEESAAALDALKVPHQHTSMSEPQGNEERLGPGQVVCF